MNKILERLQARYMRKLLKDTSVDDKLKIFAHARRIFHLRKRRKRVKRGKNEE